MEISQEHVTLTQRYPMWTGNHSDMTRILSIMEREAAALLPLHVDAKTRRARQDVERYDLMFDRLTTDVEMRGTDPTPGERARLDRYQAAREEATRALEQERADAGAAPLLALAVEEKGGRRVFTGDAESCVARLVGRDYESIQVDAPAFGSRDYEIVLAASRDGGLQFRVFSTEDRWATAVMTYLTAEAKTAAPWWHFMRMAAVLFPFFVMVFGFTLYNLGDFIAKLTNESGKFPEGIGTWISVLWIVTTTAAASVAVSVTRRWVRAFEVTPDGAKSRGRLVIAWLGGAIGAVVLSIVANNLTDVLQGR